MCFPYDKALLALNIALLLATGNRLSIITYKVQDHKHKPYSSIKYKLIKRILQCIKYIHVFGEFKQKCLNVYIFFNMKETLKLKLDN